jgi:hypothetical protein
MLGRGRFSTFNGRESNCQFLLPITWATDVQMTHARPFWTSTFQELSIDIKNTPMQDFLTPTIELWVFGSLGGLQLPTFGSVSFIPTLIPKWGCDISSKSHPLASLLEHRANFAYTTIVHFASGSVIWSPFECLTSFPWQIHRDGSQVELPFGILFPPHTPL